MKSAFTVFLILLCFATLVAGVSALPQEAAPPREISGFVRSTDGKPVPNATVMLQSVSGEVIQQITPEGGGRFVFANLDGGIYYINVVAQGFRERRERADVLSTRRVTLQILLQPVSGPTAEPAPSAVINQRLLRVPEAARKEYEKGQQLVAVGKDPRGSIPHLQKAIEKFEDFPEAYLLLGTAYMDLGQWKQAAEALQKALNLDAKLAGAHFAMGTTQAQLGNMQAAEDSLRAGLQIEPQALVGHWESARLYWTLKRIPEAETHTRKAIELAPQMAAARIMMGNICLAKRDLKSALAEFNEFLRLEPKGPTAGAAKETIRKIEEALKKQ